MRRAKRQNQQIDAQLYSTSILEELLDNSQWGRVNEIIPLTFKSVCDILQTHAQSLKDIKSLLTTRASKTELNTGLSLKANISDVTKTVDQLSRASQQRPSFQEVTSMLRDFATKADLIEFLAEHSQNSERRLQQQRKQGLEVEILKARMDDFQKEISKRVSSCVTLPQFQQVLSILQSKASSSQVNQALENKVSKQYLSTSLQKKISKSELQTILSKKADTADLDYLVKSIQLKANVSTLDKLIQVLDTKAEKSELITIANEKNHSRSHQRAYEDELSQRLQKMRVGMLQQMREMKLEIAQLREGATSLSTDCKKWQLETNKALSSLDVDVSKRISKTKMQISSQIQSVRQFTKQFIQEINNNKKQIINLSSDINNRKRGEDNIYSEIDDVRKKLQQHICRSVDKNQFIDLKSEVTEGLASKLDIDDMQSALKKLANEVNTEAISDKKQLQSMIISTIKKSEDRLLEVTDCIQVEVLQLKKSMTRKQQRGQNGNEENIRRIRKQIEQCRKTVDLAYSQIHTKISVKQYQNDLIEIRRRFQFLSKDIAAKANIKDVCVLADSKPNIDDVNNALREINEALGEKVTQADLQALMKDQATINETLCSENILGRWLWQSGMIKPGGFVPWQTETANTVPDHFFWEKDKTSILIVTAGIYEITACAFGGSGVIIMANGEQINIKNNEENSPQLSNINKKQKKKREKQFGGCSSTEYLLLPQRSRISVIFQGDAIEGFLNIHRL